MKPTKTSKQWMQEHVSDHYVQRAQKEGYRSRAAYKLLEIDARDRLLKRGMAVVDLGAAPGGWSQVAAAKGCKVVALDLLPMQPISGVEFIQGNFCEDGALAQMEAQLVGRRIGLVLSDMSPNISGISVSDQARAMHLAELALDFSLRHLKPEGAFLIKLFQGAGFEDYVKQVRRHFASAATRKPKASRDRSSEVYLLGLGKL